MATNRWYKNITNIILDFTRADAADVENKLTDVANAFDALEIEIDAGTLDVVDREARTVRHATDDLTAITVSQAARAGKILGFSDPGGDIELKTVAVVGSVLDTYSIITSGSGTLSINNSFFFDSGAGYTITLPTPATPGQFIALKFDGDVFDHNITLDGNGTTIEGDATLIVDMNYAELHLVYDGTNWKV